MTREDKAELRELRDATVDEDDKKLLRKVINHIDDLEHRLQSIRVLARTIANEAMGRNKDNG